LGDFDWGERRRLFEEYVNGEYSGEKTVGGGGSERKNLIRKDSYQGKDGEKGAFLLWGEFALEEKSKNFLRIC